MSTLILKAGKLVQVGNILMQTLSLIVTITETVTGKSKDSRQATETHDEPGQEEQ